MDLKFHVFTLINLDIGYRCERFGAFIGTLLSGALRDRITLSVGDFYKAVP